MCVEDVLVVVMLVDHLLLLKVLMNDLLCAVLMSLKMLNGMRRFLNIRMAVVFLHNGGTVGMGVLTMDDFDMPVITALAISAAITAITTFPSRWGFSEYETQDCAKNLKQRQ